LPEIAGDDYQRRALIDGERRRLTGPGRWEQRRAGRGCIDAGAIAGPAPAPNKSRAREKRTLLLFLKKYKKSDSF
jgi:hypothetical protein